MKIDFARYVGCSPEPWEMSECREHCGSDSCSYKWPGPGTFVQGTGYSNPADARLVQDAPLLLARVHELEFALQESQRCLKAAKQKWASTTTNSDADVAIARNMELLE